MVPSQYSLLLLSMCRDFLNESRYRYTLVIILTKSEIFFFKIKVGFISSNQVFHFIGDEFGDKGN